MELKDKMKAIDNIVNNTLAQDSEKTIEMICIPATYFAGDREYCTVIVVSEKADNIDWALEFEEKLNSINRPFLTKCMSKEAYLESNEASCTTVAWQQQ